MTRLQVRFTQKRPNNQGYLMGWIRIYISIDNNIIHGIHTSDVYPPYDSFLDFFQDILHNNLPTRCDIYEEGIFTVFIAEEVPNSDLVEFNICVKKDEYTDSDLKCVYSDKFKKQVLVREFITKYRTFLSDEYRPESWEEVGGPMPMSKLEQIEKELTN